MIKKPFRLLATITIFLLYGSCCNPDPLISRLDVPLYPQETIDWCWAASGQMCMVFLGATTDVSQCTQAGNEFTEAGCCGPSRSADCIQAGYPQFEKYGFQASKTDLFSALSWPALTAQIDCSKKPVAFTWEWIGGGAHMMVARGYLILGSDSLIMVNDPDAGLISVSYSEYVAGGNHFHGFDYYDITKQ